MKNFMMGRKLIALIIVAVFTAAIFTGCSGGSSKDEVYEDMQAAFEQSGLRSANIGLFSRTEKDGSVTYGEGGSGVIFRKERSDYYALTCAHVVSVPDAELLVYTVNTEMKTEDIPGIDNLNVLTEDTYDAMYRAEVLYKSQRDDFAVIRFSSDEELAVIEIAESDPETNDRIMCVGNPENEWFSISYGTVTSGMEKFGESNGYPSNVMKHSAYINLGSSGGAAINENMQLAGITPGASISPEGKFIYGVMIPASEIGICLDEWGK